MMYCQHSEKYIIRHQYPQS